MLFLVEVLMRETMEIEEDEPEPGAATDSRAPAGAPGRA
jgi:hypothetical protein